MSGTGTIVNVLAVILGSCIGLVFNGGLKQRFQDTLMQALGMATIFIGASGALKGMLAVNGTSLEVGGTMVMIISLVIGSLIGEAINIEQKMENAGLWLKSRIKTGKGSETFVEGFVTASLVTCVGAMAVVGALQDGLTGDAAMLYTKSILDFVIVIIFSSTLGIGVLFSAIPLGLYQGGITLFAGFIEPFMSEQMISNLSFVGSILIFGIGVNLAFDKKIKVGNMLPSILVVIVCSLFL